MFAYYSLVGAVFLGISFLIWGFSLNPSLYHPNLFFEIGFWLFLDGVDFMLNGDSFLHKFKRRFGRLSLAIFLGAVIGAVFDLFGVIISKTWQYPVVTNIAKVIELYVAWGVCLPMFYSGYRVVKHFIWKSKINLRIKLKNKKSLLSMLGIAGFILCLLSAILGFAFNLKGILVFALGILGMWFICEYVSFIEKRKNFLIDLVEGNPKPIIIAAIAGILTGIVWEFGNLSALAWKYTNIAFSDIKILGIPIMIILGWPALYVLFLSFYRAVFKSKGRELF